MGDTICLGHSGIGEDVTRASGRGVSFMVKGLRTQSYMLLIKCVIYCGVFVADNRTVTNLYWNRLYSPWTLYLSWET